MKRGGLTTTPPAKPSFRPDGRFAPMRPGSSEEGSNQNRLRDHDIEHISRMFHAFVDAEKYARAVPLAEIEQNDWNLNISHYVDTSEEGERIDIAEAVRKLRELEQERAATKAIMSRYLAELGYGV